MYIRGNKLLGLLEEFKATNPKKEDRIPYEEWRKLVKNLTIYKDFKLQVKTEPSTLIITYPPTDNPLRFNTGDYFIKFFQERPITTILSSPKYESNIKEGYSLTFIADDDGNRFIVTDVIPLSDYRISDVEQREVYIGKDGKEYIFFGDIPVEEFRKKVLPNTFTLEVGTPLISDPMTGQPYYQNSDGTWKSLTQYYSTDSISSSDTLNYNATITIPQSCLRLNSYGELEYWPSDWEDFSYSAEKATESLKNPTENLSKGSSNNMYLNLNNFFDFGPINDNVVMYSPYGLAFRNSNNQYLTYSPTTKKTTDVTGLTIDLEGLIYKIPVGLGSVKPGDVIIHNGKPICVETVDGNSITCVDIENSEIKVVIPPTNVFGFNYVTKITPLFNFGSASPSADNPFGNIMPYLLLSTLNENGAANKSKNGFDMQTLLLMSMMDSADGNFFGNIFGNGQA